ncbi:hypothetical protein SNEBB_008067 [Seison nebaliae]|nr:hypothetical protein SNEBB_008067 [Seison nebaliae]
MSRIKKSKKAKEAVGQFSIRFFNDDRTAIFLIFILLHSVLSSILFSSIPSFEQLYPNSTFTTNHLWYWITLLIYTNIAFNFFYIRSTNTWEIRVIEGMKKKNDQQIDLPISVKENKNKYIDEFSILNGNEKLSMKTIWEKWHACMTCGVFMPPRAYHCDKCRKCILARDHHCNKLLDCNSKEMIISLTPFTSRFIDHGTLSIGTNEHSNCTKHFSGQYLQNFSKENSTLLLNFPVTDSCQYLEVKYDGQGASLTLYLILRYNKNTITKDDEYLQFICHIKRNSEFNFDFNPNYTNLLYEGSTQNYTQTIQPIKFDIVDNLNKAMGTTEEILIGTPLLLKFEMFPNFGYKVMKIERCTAYSVTEMNSNELSINFKVNNCSTDEEQIITEVLEYGNHIILRFHAFKFVESETMKINCKINFCEDDHHSFCRNDCGDKPRKKRSAQKTFSTNLTRKLRIIEKRDRNFTNDIEPIPSSTLRREKKDKEMEIYETLTIYILCVFVVFSKQDEFLRTMKLIFPYRLVDHRRINCRSANWN